MQTTDVRSISSVWHRILAADPNVDSWPLWATRMPAHAPQTQHVLLVRPVAGSAGCRLEDTIQTPNTDLGQFRAGF